MTKRHTRKAGRCGSIPEAQTTGPLETGRSNEPQAPADMVGTSRFKAERSKHMMAYQACTPNLDLRTPDANSAETEQLIHSAKMSALGQMTAGIVHEINTPLAYLDATFTMLDRMVQELIDDAFKRSGHASDQQTALVEDIKTLLKDGIYGVGKISQLITSMNSFCRLDADRVGRHSVKKMLDDAFIMANHRLKYLEVKKNIDGDVMIHCSPSQIGQVFLNMLVNAAQALENHAQNGRITITVDQDPPDHVSVQIADNGPGIPDHLKKKIFEPFFTTKPPGEGTGLGLAICYRIVHNYGGRILLESREGVGTKFNIILPISP